MNTIIKSVVSRLPLGLSLVGGLLLAVAAPAAADTGSYGYVRVLEGSATLMQAGSGERSSAEVNQPVLAGDRLWVPGQSRVELVLADRNLLRLDGGSELVLEHLAGSPDGNDRATVLRLLEGNLHLAVTQDSLGDELPRIETPNATVYVKHYGVYRITAERSGWTEVVVRRGTAEVVTDRDSEEVRADEEAVVEGDGNTRIAVREAGGFDTLERWASRLDDDYASADSRYIDDDNLRYQAAPLARHGSWFSYGGSHYWRPRVGAGWRPYWHGRWIYTPAGMTWLASEPWGWVPYHYGTWDYLPGHGWAWLPGRVWSPAWVYWYWGPSYVGWCPTGYYTRFYGHRFGGHFGFRYGVYGWAGGDWGHFNHWNFISAGYFRDGYRHGYRDGYRDGYWDGRRDVPRFAVPIDNVRGRGPLDRGIITTDTKPLRPGTWQNQDTVLTALNVRRAGGAGTKPVELPDVTTFIARKPDLPASVTRTLGTNTPSASLDGTPLKPSTLGRAGRGNDGGGASSTRGSTWSSSPGTSAASPGGATKPRAATGDDQGQDRGGRTADSSRPSSTWEKPSRPAPDADGGAPRPGSGTAEKPVDRTSRPSRPDSGAGSSSPTWEKPSRPAPSSDGGASRPSERPAEKPARSRPPADSDGGAPRPDRSFSYEKPRFEPSNRDRSVRPEPSDRGSDRGYVRPEPSSRDRFVRPEPSDRYDRSRPSYEPRVAPAPSAPDRDRRSAEPSYKPAPRPDSGSSSSSRPEPRWDSGRSSSPSPSYKPSSPPSSSRSRGSSTRPPREAKPRSNDGRE